MTSDEEKLHRSLRESVDKLMRAFKIDEGVTCDSPQNTLNPADIHSLKFIALNTGCRNAQLANFLSVAPTTASSIVDRLVKKRLVRRERTDTNRRVVDLSLTKSGSALVEQIVNEQTDHCALMIEPLSSSEREALVRLMEKITKDLK